MNTKEKLPDVLYVEDDEVAVRLVSHNLSKVCRLEVVNEGYSAMDKVKAKQYDAILMDINLGASSPSGIEIVRMLRQLENYKNTPIIAITAFALEGDRDEFISAGCSHYITKPFTRSELMAIINDAL